MVSARITCKQPRFRLRRRLLGLEGRPTTSNQSNPAHCITKHRHLPRTIQAMAMRSVDREPTYLCISLTSHLQWTTPTIRRYRLTHLTPQFHQRLIPITRYAVPLIHRQSPYELGSGGPQGLYDGRAGLGGVDRQ